MIGKRAKILGPAHVEDLLFFAQHTRHPVRNRVIVLLSVKAGLRAAEIANLDWAMVVERRIAAARKHQRPNAPDSKGLELLRNYAEKCIMSARAYQNAIAVAATIAKLDGTDKVGRVQVA